MAGSQWRNLGLVLRRAFRQATVGVVVAFGALFSIAFNSAWPFAGAMAVVIIYALAKLQDEGFIREAVREAGDRRRRADLEHRTFRIEELDVDSRVKMKSIVKLQSEIAEDVANSPVDEVAVGLVETVQQTEGMVDRGLQMAQKRCELLKYLRRTDKHAIEQRVRTAQDKLSDEADPARKTELESLLASKKRELEDYTAIEHAAGRVLEQLDSIEAAFSELRARLVRIKSTDVSEWVAANTELRTELGALSTSVDSLEQSIDEVLTLGGPQ